MFEDKTISCRNCRQPFVFSAGEQEFFSLKMLKNAPTRCPNCRITQRLERQGKDPALSSEVPCHECGAMARVPFKPNGSKPVFCSTCFQKQRTG
ncbi:MAG: zinc-binding protein [Cyanobacteria bacterium DS3.002]|nr:zinc-binding protein [Cyanobacteria bacterium DS3.002]MBA4049730.1 zinc-binding protein [Cyanobacteria bacterium DS2.008]MBA4073417.1 zinc-binding protein [Cyanobacteria bacterium PR.023]